MGGGALGARRLAENLTDGFEDLGSVLRDETDGFSVDDESIVLDGGLDDEIFAGRDTDEQGEFEVDGAEAVEEPDEAIGVAAADGEAAATEGFPTRGDGQVELFIVDATEELGVGGGATSGDGSEGAALSEETAKFEGRVRVGGDLRFVHTGSGSQTGHKCPADDSLIYC